ncbi:hypothetical protein [Cryptosporangium aurantiacum]|uniref:Tetratricopeptide repeat-containing protein n=1 Tax=Cryptosporangium aurantiacum TaxID=134849 RepID=A0A1M7IQJ4_9ACTN|nr:hypothetical protein [Cryptosporangium aurantiacum]SHM42961.1 hypothetical protein SAMN05443668_101563 [Cryptosporangium aurantiacum]
MKIKAIVAVLVVVLAVYLAIAVNRGLVLLRTGDLLLVGLGVAMLALPLLASWLVWLEIKFGRAAQRLADELADEGGLPVDDLPRRPSGRPVREAADERFAVRQAELEEDPEDWRRWFRLSLAYDDSGDRRRARAALRRSISLHDGGSTGPLSPGDARTGQNL